MLGIARQTLLKLASIKFCKIIDEQISTQHLI